MGLATLADRLETALRAFSAMEDRIEAAGPWPLAEAFGTEPEAAWGPAELLAHVDEALRFWSGEVERALATPPAATPFAVGRALDDQLRLGMIARDRHLPIGELLDRTMTDGGRVLARLRALTDDEAARTVDRLGRGSLTVAELLETTIAGHLEGHVGQLEAILASRAV